MRGRNFLGLCLACAVVLGVFLAHAQPSPPFKQIDYGAEPKQFGELYLPPEPGLRSVILLVHGGAWQSAATVASTHAAAQELARRGYAVWNIEYRALGDGGGGFPGTFLDVAKGTDHLRELAKNYPLDLSCVVAVGHSAGGHLAMWIAGRKRLPTSSPLYKANSLGLRGVVDLAGPPDLRAGHDLSNAAAGEGAIETLIGADPRGFDAALKDTSPAELLPLGVRQILLFGGLDQVVPAEQGALFRRAAAARGEKVDLRIVAEAQHTDFIAPWTGAWKESLKAIGDVCAPKTSR
jgi:acetyl esterase/lipase